MVISLLEMVSPELVLVEQHGHGNPNFLYAEELALVASAVPKRQREFASGRSCAKTALKELGIKNFPLLTGLHREPIWPVGIIGSITHTEQYCAVVTCRSDAFASIGIDAEVVGGVGKELWPLVFTNEERSQLNNTSSNSQGLLATVFFSAKESFFKCQFPITRKWLDFLDVAVRVDGSSIIVQANKQNTLGSGHGRYCYCKDNNIVLTLITAPSDITRSHEKTA